MEKITARTNDRIKHAVRLGESASLRKEAGEFFLEGARLCFDAVQTGIKIKQAFFTAKALRKYSEYTDSIIEKSGVCCEISAEVAQKLSDTENPQGVFCICAMSNNSSAKLNPDGKYLALENLQDPSNLGAVCRSAEALGLDGLIVSGGCDVYNPKALRAAMGSSLRMPVISAENLPALLREANALGMQTLASVPRNTATDIRTVSMDGEEISVTPTEYAILKLLMSEPDTVFSTKEICAKALRLGMSGDTYGAENNVAVHIRHLREKIEIDPANPRYLKVVWGRGYKIDAANTKRGG